MAIKGWEDGHCPFCGDEADIVYPAIHDNFDEAAVLCGCQKDDDEKYVPTVKLRNTAFWDSRLEA